MGDSIAPASKPGTAETVTVNLIARAAQALTASHERSGMTRTDIINRALQLYDFTDSELADGGELLILKGGSYSRVKLQ